MAYVKILYQDSPSTATPLNAQNLNHMDDQIALNDQRLTEIETSYVKSFNSRTGDVTPEKNDYDISLIGATAGEDGYVPVWRNSGTEEEPNWGFEMEAQGGAGHVLVDSDGNDMPSEDKMQFADAFLSDDDANGKTVVENIKEVLPADYDSTTDEGIIVCDNGEDAVIHPSSDDYVEVTADGVKTRAQLLTDLNALVDWSKVNENSYIVFGNDIYRVNVPNVKIFMTSAISYGHLYNTMFDLNNHISQQFDTTTSTTTLTDNSSNKLISGIKITLYYGNKKAVVDLQTTANRCLLNSGQTVEAKVATLDLGSHANLTSFETAIKNKLSTMKKGDVLTGVISTAQSFSPFNISGGQSIIIQARGDNNSTVGLVQVWNQLGYIFYGFLSSDTFTWKTPTLN